MRKSLIIGITGGIGSGKSSLSDNLRAAGYPVYDSDMEARRLQNDHPIIRKQLKQLFGDDIYTPQGLNRGALAKIVFGNVELLAMLNSIVHPVVKADFSSWIKSNSLHKMLFMESAILFESGFNALVDKVIVITASESVRIARVVKRDGVTEEQVRVRIANQQPDEMKISLADFVIYSDDNLPLLDKMNGILFKLTDFI